MGRNVYFRSGSLKLSAVLRIPNGMQQGESRPARSRRGSSYLTPAVHCPINQGAWTRTRARQTCRNPGKMSVIATVATPYNVKTDFAPLAKIATTPFALVVNPEKITASDAAGFLGYMKANPGRLSYASVGVGTPHHLGMEWFKAVTGLDLVHVPYRGTAPALADMVAGHTQLMFATVSAVTGLIEKGQLRALATAENKRIATLPDVPTLAEAGVPGIEFSSWYGLLAKAGTPTAIQQKLSEALLEIINEGDTKDKIISAGFELSSDGPQETQRLLNAELDKWGAIIKKIGLKPE